MEEKQQERTQSAHQKPKTNQLNHTGIGNICSFSLHAICESAIILAMSVHLEVGKGKTEGGGSAFSQILVSAAN